MTSMICRSRRLSGGGTSRPVRVLGMQAGGPSVSVNYLTLTLNCQDQLLGGGRAIEAWLLAVPRARLRDARQRDVPLTHPQVIHEVRLQVELGFHRAVAERGDDYDQAVLRDRWI